MRMLHCCMRRRCRKHRLSHHATAARCLAAADPCCLLTMYARSNISCNALDSCRCMHACLCGQAGDILYGRTFNSVHAHTCMHPVREYGEDRQLQRMAWIVRYGELWC